MKPNARLIFVVALSLFLLPIFQFNSQAQIGDSLYFPETDHFVDGIFLEKYSSAPDPEIVFGYPLTEDLVPSGDSPFAGKQVQYFQRVVFEYKRENLPGYQVQLVPLGEIMFEGAQYTAIENLPANHPACKYFDQTGHQVCYAFLNFFETYGGNAIFGYPISDLVLENNRIIQYFENARFEWHPELAAGKKVQLTNLGEILFRTREKRDLGVYKQTDSIPEIKELRVHGFPAKAVLSNSGSQTIYIVVQDQLNKGVANADVTLTFVLPNNQTEEIDGLKTNQDGVATYRFDVGNQPFGRVEVLIEATYGSQITKVSRTSYRIW